MMTLAERIAWEHERTKEKPQRSAGEIIKDNDKMWSKYTERLEAEIKELTNKLERIQLILNGERNA